MEDAGFELIDSTTFVEEQLPAKGTLTIREPSFAEWEDIYFGVSLAKQIAHLDIGQTVAVKHKAIVGVEAFEGTDNLIKRAGSLAGKGVVVVKVSRPRQDMRFDIPVVGLNTIKNLINISASCLAIEAGKTLFIDRVKGIALANRRGLSIVAI
ncbi:MAG: LpxI family protein [Candidatus Omnitrophota bacterium]